MSKKKKTIILTVIICLAAVLAVAGILLLPKASEPDDAALPTTIPVTTAPAATQEVPTEAETTAPTVKGYHEVQPGEDISAAVADVIRSPEYVEPGPGALDVDKIQGLTPSDPQSSETGSETTPTPRGTVLSDPNLSAEVVAKYSGSYVEDGTNAATTDVTAMVITNNSDKMLQIGAITFQVNDSQTAEFTVTNLPAGASALVMESSRRTFRDGDDFSYGRVASSYIDMPTLESDKFDILEEDGKLTLVNKTGETYGKVYVYYKYVQLGGAYLGGITYRVPFENVPANGRVESVAGHFRPEGSKIVGVVIMPEA